jgi:hypothetical protein
MQQEQKKKENILRQSKVECFGTYGPETKAYEKI